MRYDGGTGPLTSGSGRMGSKDPVGISGRMARSDRASREKGYGVNSDETIAGISTRLTLATPLLVNVPEKR